jgi:hypothetical protein
MNGTRQLLRALVSVRSHDHRPPGDEQKRRIPFANEDEPMVTAVEIGAGLLLSGTLLLAAMFLAAFQLGRLITRDDEQREVARRKDAHDDVIHGRQRRRDRPFGRISRGCWP